MSGKRELSNSDSTSEESKIEATKEQKTAKTVVLSSSSKPECYADNQVLKQKNSRKVLKIKESPKFHQRASALFQRSFVENENLFSFESVLVSIINKIKKYF